MKDEQTIFEALEEEYGSLLDHEVELDLQDFRYENEVEE